MDNEQEFGTTELLVREIMRTDERARNNDKWLTYCVIQRICRWYSKTIYIPYELFEKLPSYETISRVRRRCQNDKGLYPATDPGVIEKRSIREKFVRKWAVTPNAD